MRSAAYIYSIFCKNDTFSRYLKIGVCISIILSQSVYYLTGHYARYNSAGKGIIILYNYTISNSFESEEKII